MQRRTSTTCGTRQCRGGGRECRTENPTAPRRDGCGGEPAVACPPWGEEQSSPRPQGRGGGSGGSGAEGATVWPAPPAASLGCCVRLGQRAGDSGERCRGHRVTSLPAGTLPPVTLLFWGRLAASSPAWPEGCEPLEPSPLRTGITRLVPLCVSALRLGRICFCTWSQFCPLHTHPRCHRCGALHVGH